MEIPDAVVSSRGISTLSSEERKEYAILNEEDREKTQQNDNMSTIAANRVTSSTSSSSSSSSQIKQEHVKDENSDNCITNNSSNNNNNNNNMEEEEVEEEEEEEEYYDSSDDEAVERRMHRNNRANTAAGMNGKEKEKGKNNTKKKKRIIMGPNNDNGNAIADHHHDDNKNDGNDENKQSLPSSSSFRRVAATAAATKKDEGTTNSSDSRMIPQKKIITTKNENEDDNIKHERYNISINNNKVATINNWNDDDDNTKEGSRSQPIPSYSEYIPQPIDPPNSCNNMISIGNRVLTNRMEHTNPSIIEICATMKRICNNNASKNRIFVSLCCGTAATEINSNEICLCLDTDRRSLFNACIDLKQSKKKTIWMSFFDYSNETLKDLLEQLKETTKKRISVLYQHPSPSPATLKKFSQSCSKVAASLLEGHVMDICMVYDHKSTGNCWNEGTITKAFFNDIGSDDQALIKPTKMALICASDSDIVYHPYFGSTKRYGLTEVKKGEECRIFFSKKQNKKRKRGKKKKK